MPFFAVIALVAYQILLIFVHLALYATVAAAFGIGGPVTAVVFMVLAVSFVVMSVSVFKSGNRFVAMAYAASAYWFGLSHFLFSGGVAYFFAATFLYGRNIYIAPSIIGGISFGTFFLVHLYGTWNSGRAEITEISVAIPNLPASWRGKKAVFVSDLHLGAVHGARFAAKVAMKVQALAPEAIFIGGDMYDGVKCDPDKLIEPLRPLRAPLGVYFITGNHDEFQDAEKFLRAIRDIGIRVLDNEKVDCGGMQLVGVDYKAVYRKEDFERILKTINVDRKTPSIILKHEPSNLDVPEKAGFSLTLAGHTHRGQIFPLFLFTRKIYKGFDYGLKRLGNMQVMTSSGVGTWGPPLRIGTKSEIVLIKFV